MIERIAILGGSSVYTPEFILSLVSRNLNVREIALMGRSGAKLEVVSRFCQRLLDKSGFPAKIISTNSVAEAVTGAKYTLNHIRVGGMQARLRDEKLPPRFGMVGDETIGAGGFANAMRTLPVVFDLVGQIERANPDTTFINLTNPMGIIVEALVKYSKLNVIGVTDLPWKYVKKLANLMGLQPTDIEINYIGLNHMGWIQDVKYNGTSIISQILEKLDEREDEEFDYDLIELFRMIPTRNTSLYFHAAEILKQQQQTTRFRAELLFEAERQILNLYKDEALTEVPHLARERNAIWYEETILPLIEALESEKEITRILCVKNEGSIRDLNENCSVEIPVSVSSAGLRPHKVGSCPHFLSGYFLAVKQSDRLTVEAAYHKSYEYALQALNINPLVSSYASAKDYLDQIIRDEGFELH